jgi:hypothetical protein
MKIRNTTDFETAELRHWLRRVVREVQATLRALAERGEHPRSWHTDAVDRRAAEILANCDVWVRQTRRDLTRETEAGVSGWLAHAEKASTARGVDAAKEHAEHWAIDSGTGRASYSGRHLRMTIHGADISAFVWLARHETWHLFGLRHEHFPHAVMHETKSSGDAVREVYGIADATFTIPIQAEPSPEEREASKDREREKKLAGVLAKQARWSTKLKRAQTALGKLKRQRTYYERQIAIAASGKPRTP